MTTLLSLFFGTEMCLTNSSGSCHVGRARGVLWLYFVYRECAALKGMFFTISVWQGVCFDPGLILLFWQKVVIFPFFSGKGG